MEQEQRLTVDDKTQHRSVVEYLCEICGLRADQSARMAAMTILSDLLRSAHVSDATKQICLQANILTYLDDILDLATSARTLDAMNIVHLKLALQIIWELSLAHVCVQENMVDEAFLKKVMAFIKFENSPLVRYNNNGTSFLKDICEGKHLIAQISDGQVDVNLNTLDEGDGDIVSRTSLAICPSTALECRLFDTTGSEDVDIVTEFVKKGHAFKITTRNTFSDDCWKDIVVTSVVSGPIFWGQIGEKVILTSQKIQLILETEDLVPCVPTVADHVAVRYNSAFIRCKIINNYGNYVIVMAVDYGEVFMVPEDTIFKLPLSAGLLQYKPQAKLCCLSGVSPNLLDRNIQQIAIGILSNLCRYKVLSGPLLYNMDVFKMLETTLFCPVQCLVIQSLCLTNNLINNPRLVKKICSETILKWLLDICKKLPYQELSKESAEKTAFYVFTCLASLLCRFKDRKNDYYHEQGLEITLTLISRHRIPSIAYRRGIRVLKNYISTYDRSVHQKNFLKQRSADDNPSIKLSAVNDEEKPPILKSLDIYEEVDSSDDEDYRQVLPSILSSPDDGADQDICQDADQVARTSHRNQYYIQNENIGLCNSTTTELVNNRTLISISSTELIEVICSMLNTRKGGTVYFGIETDGGVFGLYLSRTERDDFRVGVDKLMNEQMKPSVLHYQFSIAYIPVKQRDMHTEELNTLDNVYVPEIHVDVDYHSDIFYTCFKGQCYYRFGDKTKQLNIQDIRQLVVLEEEVNYRKEIQTLQRKLHKMQP